MFASFFPRPRLFFPSAALWAALAVGFWYAGGKALGDQLGFAAQGPPIIGVQKLWSGPFVWFDIYYGGAVALFAGLWRLLDPHPWWRWSVLGTALILYASYLVVQLNVILNAWFGPFYDTIQAALGRTKQITIAEYYGLLATFLGLAMTFVVISALLSFFTSHYIFRWRTAMNNYYVSHWPRLRRTEGASQRVQEDTMRFASTMEALGLNFINSMMSLIAFTPVLLQLSAHIQRLPLIGATHGGLFFAAFAWAVFGTGFIALVGIRLPGLEFRNQRVEAAYRKELVYGEDHDHRAQPQELVGLFADIRRNYFAVYRNFIYFNLAREGYGQINSIIAYVVLGPSIVAGIITLGLLQRTLSAFNEVLGSFQYLVSSWEAIVVLQSIYKRLRAFEAVIRHEALPRIEATAGP